jgi:hypothetical protein
MVVGTMALDAPAHLRFLDRNAVPPERIGYEIELVNFLYGTMATLTVQPGRYMAVVPKFYVLRKAINLIPLDGALLFPMLL